MLDEFERSGLSGAKFAAPAGIKYQLFAAWAVRRRKHVAGGKQREPLTMQQEVEAELLKYAR